MEATLRIAGATGATANRAISRRINFTIQALTALKPPAGKDRTWVHDKTPGLALLAMASGAKSFYLYKKINGRPQRIRLGGFPEISIEQARRMATTMNGQIADGKDPASERKAIRKSAPLGDVWDRYLADHLKVRCSAQTIITDKSRWKTCFDGWTTRSIISIRTDDVAALHLKVARERGQISANRAVQLLRRLLNFAHVDPNPCKAVKFFDETSRERYAYGDELIRLFAALDAADDQRMADYIRMSLYTGARRANVLGMRWEDVHLDARTWKIPADQSKSGKAMEIHLAEPALAILRARQTTNNAKPKDERSPFVLPGYGSKSGHLEEPKAFWKATLKAAEIKDLHLHDLRRSLGSWMVASGASLPLIGKQLGHQDVATTAVYARLNIDPTRHFVDAAVAAMTSVKPAEQAKDEGTK